ncbi:uncharacterized protein LOC144332227 [Macaca mulatta]
MLLALLGKGRLLERTDRRARQPGPPLASMWARLLIAACFGPVSVALTLLRKCLQSICAPRPSPGPAVCSSRPTQHKHSTRIAPNVGVLFIKCLPIAQVPLGSCLGCSTSLA